LKRLSPIWLDKWIGNLLCTISGWNKHNCSTPTNLQCKQTNFMDKRPNYAYNFTLFFTHLGSTNKAHKHKFKNIVSICFTKRWEIILLSQDGEFDQWSSMDHPHLQQIQLYNLLVFYILDKITIISQRKALNFTRIRYLVTSPHPTRILTSLKLQATNNFHHYFKLIWRLSGKSATLDVTCPFQKNIFSLNKNKPSALLATWLPWACVNMYILSLRLVNAFLPW